MFSCGFFADSKISQLSQGSCLTYVWLLTVCSDCGGGELKDTFECHAGQLPLMLKTGGGRLEERLDQLQSLQLLKYSKSASNIIEKNIKEENLREKKSQAPRDEAQKLLNFQIWEAYKMAYLNRYKVEPIRNASTNAKISQLGKRVGIDAVELVGFYLKHNDGFYLKNVHSIGLCLSNAESLHTQMKRNQPVTSVDIRNFEKQQNMRTLTKAIDEGENF